MNLFLGYILKLKFLSGFRTYIAAIGMIGLSVYSFSEGHFDAGMTQLMMALGALGIYEQAKQPTPVQLPDVLAPVIVTPQPITPDHPLISELIAAIEAKIKQKP